jgi:hypothetical protein
MEAGEGFLYRQMDFRLFVGCEFITTREGIGREFLLDDGMMIDSYTTTYYYLHTTHCK